MAPWTRNMVLLAACATAAFVAMVPASAWAQGPKTRLVQATRTVPAEGTLVFRVSCPRGQLAINGQIVSAPVRVTRTDRASQRAWRFGLFNPMGEAARVRVGVLCISGRFDDRRGAAYRTVASRGKAVEVRYPETQTTRLRAPSGRVPAGIEARPRGASGSRAGASLWELAFRDRFWLYYRSVDFYRSGVLLTRAELEREIDSFTFVFALLTLGTKPDEVKRRRDQTAEGSATAARGVPAKARVKKWTRTLEPGTQEVRGSCPPRHLALATGYDFGSGFARSMMFMNGNWAGPGRRGTWDLWVGERTTMTFSLRCLDLRPWLRR